MINNSLTLKKIKDNKTINAFFIGGIIGLILFLIIYGWRILNITYVDWLYEDVNSDLFQTQLGADFFLKAPWKFPLGCYDTYNYPSGTSIVFTDSIPIFAIVFKLFRGMLPTNIQYLGIWGAFSFFMQGGISCVILKKYIKKLSIVAAICPILIFNTATIWRLYRHTSLGGGQWIILLALMICVYRKNINKTWKKVFIWSGITAITVSIHIYFIIMIGIILVAYLINDYLENNLLKEDILIFISAVISTIVSFYIIGGFAVGSSIVEEGLGMYSMNINSLFNPMGYSNYLKDLPSNPGQYEGLQYLGAGAIILLIAYIFSLNKDEYVWFKELSNSKKIPIIFGIVSLTILALSPVITINTKTLVNYMFLKPIVDLLNPFRSTGRFFWPVYYVILFFLIIKVSQKYKNTTKLFLCFALCSCIQFSDFVMNMAYNSSGLKEKYEYNNKLESKLWNDLATKVKHVELITNGGDEYQKIAWYAAQNNLTMNTGYFSRKNYELIEEDMINSLKEITTGNIRKDTMYCIPEKYIFNNESFTNNKIVEFNVDGFRIIVSKEIINFEKYNEIIKKENSESKKDIVELYIKILNGELDKDILEENRKYQMNINDTINDSVNNGEIIFISGKLKNSSNQDFYSYSFLNKSFCIYYEIIDKNGKNIAKENRYYFNKEIKSGESQEFKLNIDIPENVSGNYTLKIDCLQEGVALFGEYDGQQYLYNIKIN